MNVSRILVPVNGSPADQEALQLACSIAKKNRGKIFAIYVIEVTRSLPLDAEIKPETEKGEGVLERAEHIAELEDYEVETELLQSRDVGSAIVDEAVERAVDLIIMGILNKKRFGEFNLGKTTPYVLKNAPCRVWVCREPSGV